MMTASIKERIRDAMKVAMKAGDKPRLGVIRLMMADIKRREVDERIELDDHEVIVVLDKMLKQRRESIAQYRPAGREDLALVEEQEITVIQDFLPQPLSEDEINAIVLAAITASNATAIKDMGKVMGLVKPKMQGRADMSIVSVKIKGILSAS
ncbi:MAG TPA: GatB/YqeY domain-containing protein [Methylococcaceae bacterium]|nr:GatB/YqeY domain-containing protein [Methylococcaceae bacterium]HIN69214.1 GatB/YqeY domain-containing protein [Methylococcales bacterium]HIA44866.1 GatB/YqeY domain-containing protein [Methylococcaceae bacterium]HIB62923.1 GatB/YqeY domain-containing protein [Methylococcaceae bacterium]HIO12728.1 GatB/YqeY domain-containing protein [Methylococcales bacterium]